VLRLAEGTSLGSDPDAPVPERLDMLALTRSDWTWRVAAELDLREYFRTVKAHGLIPRGDGWEASCAADPSGQSKILNLCAPRQLSCVQPGGQAAGFCRKSFNWPNLVRKTELAYPANE
jgi:hypothetical protein